MCSARPLFLSEVSIIRHAGEWRVAVREDGKESVRDFEQETHALAFAEGQRVRLGLEKISAI
jgi:hypothetical protein